MRGRAIWMLLALFLGLAGAATAQSFEICDVAGDEDGDGLTDCADPDCAGDLACGVEVLCAETDAEPLPSFLKHNPAQCSNWATDTDGRNFTTPGCLTYWNDNTCANGVVNHKWDTCNGNKLTEWYTGGVGKMGCGSVSQLVRDCSDLVTCPDGALPTCQAANIFCGGAVRASGQCVCPPRLIAGTDTKVDTIGHTPP